MQIIKGKSLRGGIALGKVYKISDNPTVEKQLAQDLDLEKARLKQSIAVLQKTMEEEIQQAEPQAKEILEAQESLLLDASFSNTINKILTKENCCAEFATQEAGRELAAAFQALEDAYLKARAEDMLQVANRLINALQKSEQVLRLTEPVILVAEEFSPAQLAALDKNMVLGLVAHKGSATSHTAILATNYGLPYIGDITPELVNTTAEIILDGDSGCVIIDPDEVSKEWTKAKLEEQATLKAKIITTKMKVYANISNPEDLPKAVEMHADGIGLYRTEFLFMNRAQAPDEEEQFKIYRQAVEAFPNKEVIIRTIDAGTDKPVDYLELPQEENPALGIRGVRVSLEHPQLFRVQLRALLRAAAYGHLGIMFPMITSVKEITAIKEQVSLAEQELQATEQNYKMPKLGIMIETPAAALISQELAKEVDFFSIGTNDLTQYTIAVDRQGEDLDNYYNPYHEAIYKLIELTIQGAHQHSIPVGLCGELGSNPQALARLVKAGLDEVSVGAATIPTVRKNIAVAEAELAEAEALHNEATTDENTNQSDISEPAEEVLSAPAAGRLIAQEDIPDETFSKGILGPCFAVEPTEGNICAPISGTIISIAGTKHAICIRTNAGTEVLVHVGIDTVKLQGKPFKVAVKENQLVEKGELLLEADLEAIKAAGCSTITPVIICNLEISEAMADQTEVEQEPPKNTPIIETSATTNTGPASSVSAKVQTKISFTQYIQQLGKAIMLPVAVLPICGILMGLGYLLCPATMQGGNITGFISLLGLFLVKAGAALIDNMALLFVIGVGAGMSKNNDGVGAVAALASWLMLTTLLNAGFVTKLMPDLANNANAMLAFGKIANPFIGILAGVIGAMCFNRFKDFQAPEFLSFFSGKRSVAIVAGIISILVAGLLLFIWPILFSGLITLGQTVAGMGAVGAGIYAFLNRLLIPVGLHHALNNVFWFDTIGLGDLTHYWAGHTSKDVTWSLGMYMSGFFPCMMFGVPGAALAMVHTVKDKAKRQLTIGLLMSAAICSFVCGVTEPFEFAFMFVAPMLYLAYSALYGIFTFLVAVLGFRAGFCFSGGAIDLLFSASLPAAAKTWLILPLGLAAFVSFYVVFRFMIEKFNLPTPGRESGIEEAVQAFNDPANNKSSNYTQQAELILQALGGKENILTLDNCITRLRLEVKDKSLIKEQQIKAAGALNVIHTGASSLQVVIGTKVQFVADEMQKLL